MHMKKYEVLSARGLLSLSVVEPQDMTSELISELIKSLDLERVNNVSVAMQAFSMVRQQELMEELQSRDSNFDETGLYMIEESGFGVSVDMFLPNELHETEWQKQIDRLESERFTIQTSEISAPARLIFIEIRLAEFKFAQMKY